MRLIVYLFASLTITLVLALFYQNNKVPELGVVGGKFKPLKSSPNGVSSQANDATKMVETLPLSENQQETIQNLLNAIQQYGGAQIITQEDDYIYAVFKTPKAGWKDDVELWLDKREKKVHYRSSSRAGYSDRGLNRKRYEELTRYYKDLL